nr:MAG TPA: hypothetical protein [Caudoviricetes sp.]
MIHCPKAIKHRAKVSQKCGASAFYNEKTLDL